MKRTLRGKRHIRAAQAVGKARKAKRIKKFNQTIKVISRSAPHISRMFLELVSDLKRINAETKGTK